MVGRDAELLTLREAFRHAVETSTTHVVSVIGEAGLGKSRLLYEFSDWLELLPESDTVFFVRDTGANVTFVRENGRVVALIYTGTRAEKLE